MSNNSIKAHFSLPNYRRIEDDLRTRLIEGHWLVGRALPSRVDLAREYGVDLRTLQRAITPLLREGLLEAKVPNGTFVTERGAPGHAKRRPTRRASATDGAGEEASRTSGAGQQSHLEAPPPLRARASVGIISRQVHYAANPEPGLFRYVVMEGVERVIAEQTSSSLHAFERQRPDSTTAPMKEAVETLIAAGINLLLIILEQDENELMEAYEIAQARHIPVALVTFQQINIPVPQAFWDTTYAGYQAATHLFDRGYRNLLFFAPFHAPWVADRVAGVRVAALQADLPTDALDVMTVSEPSVELNPNLEQAEIAYQAAKKIAAAQLARPDVAIVAVNDHVAEGFIRAAQEIGKVAGKDYGLIGFDDSQSSRQLGLTSLHAPLSALGQHAAIALLDTLRGKPLPPQMRLRSYVVPRASTQRGEQ